MDAVLANLRGWAQQVFVVDSLSRDGTVSRALAHGAHVVQRRFRNFGDQWNFALRALPVTAPWTMKLDPDERLTAELKTAIVERIEAGDADGLEVVRRLRFLGRPLPVSAPVTRLWRTGRCRFTDVTVNEHPLVDGTVVRVAGDLEHFDSPDLEHWLAKQNRYTTAEARAQYDGVYAAEPRLLGDRLQRRTWMKRHFGRLPGLPGRYVLLFLYHYLVLGAWRAGRTGWVWAHLRTTVYRLTQYKLEALRRGDPPPGWPPDPGGRPDSRVRQYD